MMNRLVFVAVVAVLSLIILPLSANDSEDLAIDGYDPVAYFTQAKPTEGSADYEVTHEGKTWRFVSAENRDLFQGNPDKYLPQYGAYCAYAVANGYTASVDPNAWKVVDEKLYLNFSLSVQKLWEKDIPGNIKKADANWPKLKNK